MRARNIKPGLFKNEILGGADPLLTILFEGLWCMADREGRLEDRPLRISAEVFPYRKKCNEKVVDKMLQWLHEENLICRYAVGKERYIEVLMFLKHQHPHKKEAPSTIPALSSLSHGASTGVAPESHQTGLVKAPDKHQSGPADSLIPDSGSLIPDCVIPTAEPPGRSPEGTHAHRESNGSDSNAERRALMLRLQDRSNPEGYPKFTGNQDWLQAEAAIATKVAQGAATLKELEAGVARYRRFVDAGGASDPRFVYRPGRFFTDPADFWRQPWEPPPRARSGASAEATAAWDLALAFVRRGGYRNEPGIGNARIDAAVRAIGGYSKIGNANDHQVTFLRVEFVKAFLEEVAA